MTTLCSSTPPDGQARVGRVKLKRLSQRHHRCSSAWPGSEPVLQAAFEQVITNQPASGRTRPSSFGVRLRQSQSGSSATGLQANAKSQDAVALPKRRARAWKRRR